MAQNAVVEDDLFEHRLGMYEALGFTAEQANALAAAYEREHDAQGRTWLRRLYHGRVADALADGCTHELAVAIFA
jgi:hypothetical protein